MVKTETYIPKLRFKGFTDDWKSKELGKLSTRVTRKNTDLESDLPLTISAQYGLVDQRTYFDRQIASRDISGYFLINNGEFAYNKSYSNGYPLGAIKRLDKYESGVLSTLYIVFKPDDKFLCSDYLASYYDTNYWHKEVSMYAAEGARNHGLLNIAPADFFKTRLKFTVNMVEQTQIGTFFQKIDQVIELQQKALATAQDYKKAMLQKMFPQQGEKIPQIRFAGFSGDWEERQLKQISSRVTEKNTNIKITETFTNSAEKGIISQRDYFDRNISNDINLGNYYIVKPNDFVYNPRISKTAPVGPIKRNKLGRTGVVSPLYTVFSPIHVNMDFLEQYFLTTNWHIFMNLNGDKGARADRLAINISTFQSMPIKLPNSLQEQQKIGVFFQKLDTQIEQDEKKLATYQNFKKAMLQRMFV